jgi:hypothetical protein
MNELRQAFPRKVFNLIIPGDKLSNYAIIERGLNFREKKYWVSFGEAKLALNIVFAGFPKAQTIKKVSLIRVGTLFNIVRYMLFVC